MFIENRKQSAFFKKDKLVSFLQKMLNVAATCFISDKLFCFGLMTMPMLLNILRNEHGKIVYVFWSQRFLNYGW